MSFEFTAFHIFHKRRQTLFNASSSCILLFQAQTKIAKKSALGKSETDEPGRIVVLRACLLVMLNAQATGSDNCRQLMNDYKGGKNTVNKQ